LSTLFRYRIQDQNAALRVDADELLEAARALHSVCCHSRAEVSSEEPADLVWTRGGGDGFQIVLKGEIWENAMPLDDLFFQSENLLTQIFSEKLNHLLQLHAGTVQSPNGNGWTIIGQSQAGKTSLTLALAMLGWRWLSDELACVPEAEPLILLSFPRNFNLKEHSWVLFPETAGGCYEIYSKPRKMRVRFIDPDVIVPGKSALKAPWKGILAPVFDPGAKVPELRVLGPMESFQKMVPEVLNWTPWGMAHLSSACQNLRAFELRYGNSRDAAKMFSETG
jgi:hypothetical protein